MTDVAEKVIETRKQAAAPWWFWGVQTVVLTGAMWSLVAFRDWGVWVDVRAGYWLGMKWLEAVGVGLLWMWLASLVVVQGAMGVERVRAWVAGWRWRRALMWPTMGLVGVLLVNLALLAGLILADRVDEHPPVAWCVVVLVILTVWLRGARRWLAGGCERVRRGGWLRWAAEGLIVLAVGVLQGGVMGLHHADNPPPAPVDLAVVFGYGVRDDGEATVALRDRVLAAVQLYKRGQVRYIMLSGSLDDMTGKGDFFSESAVMAEVCKREGVPAGVVIHDPVGVNTRATVEHSKRVMAKLKLRSMVAVSSDYHMARIRLAYQQAGMNVYSVGSKPTEWIQGDVWGDLREVAGLPVYALMRSYRPAKVEVMAVKSPRLVVFKSKNRMELFDGERLVKAYPCITGTHPGNKETEGDRRTPEGRFRICYKNPESRFHLSLGLDYPDAAAAERGKRSGLISEAEYQQIMTAAQTGGIPNWYTKLGGEIFIHGCAEGRTSTAGCVAVSNPDIEELYALCEVGTVVEIRP